MVATTGDCAREFAQRCTPTSHELGFGSAARAMQHECMDDVRHAALTQHSLDKFLLTVGEKDDIVRIRMAKGGASCCPALSECIVRIPRRNPHHYPERHR